MTNAQIIKLAKNFDGQDVIDAAWEIAEAAGGSDRLYRALIADLGDRFGVNGVILAGTEAEVAEARAAHEAGK